MNVLPVDLLDRGSELLPLGAPAGKGRAGLRVRLVSASKVPLARSGLRPDLSERLAEGYLWTVPTLAERKEDIPGLIQAFLDELRDEAGIDATLTDEAIRFAASQAWPGQIRELRAAVRALVLAAHARRAADGLSSSRVVVREADMREREAERAAAFGDRPDAAGPHGSHGQTQRPAFKPSPPTLAGAARPLHPRALTAADIEDALLAAGGNRTRAAELLGIARNTLLAKLKRMQR